MKITKNKIILLKNEIVDEPILIEKKSNLTIILEENSQAEIIQFCKYNDLKFNQKIKINLKKNSTLTFYTIQYNSNHTKNNLEKHAKIDGNATLNLIDIYLGNKELNSKDIIELLKPNSKSITKCITFSNKDQIYNIEQEIIHKSKSAQSQMFHRGILNDTSQTNYKAIIKVQKNCPNTKSFQKSENILLSEECNCTSTPVLEVLTDNVSCSHGASISHLNEDKLFYLLSRSLNEKEAKQIILEGFITELILNEKVKTLVIELITQKEV